VQNVSAATLDALDFKPVAWEVPRQFLALAPTQRRV